jgi:DNA polymerase V
VASTSIQTSFFPDQLISDTKKTKVMQVVDNINRTLGKNSIQIATEGFKQAWGMRQNKKTPRYTTRWDEILTIHN